MSTLPNGNNRWQNPDLKIYATDIAIDDPPATLRPGMSARVEILVTEIPSAIYVPAQAVAIASGKPSVWVRGSDGDAARSVTLGLSSDRYTQILDGLAEGEVVLLAPPKDPSHPGAGSERGNGKPGDGKPAGRGSRSGPGGGMKKKPDDSAAGTAPAAGSKPEADAAPASKPADSANPAPAATPTAPTPNAPAPPAAAPSGSSSAPARARPGAAAQNAARRGP
jgi:hypothetical protein